MCILPADSLTGGLSYWWTFLVVGFVTGGLSYWWAFLLADSPNLVLNI